jgi:hypothetical protein
MLKTYAFVFTLPAVCCSAYVDDTDHNACVLCVWYGFTFISDRSIQNSEFAKNACVFQYRLHLSSLFNVVL